MNRENIAFVEPVREHLIHLLEETHAERRRRQRSCCGCCWPLSRGYPKQTDKLIRFGNTILVFGLVFTSALLSSSPWVLSWIQMVVMTFVYILTDPGALTSRTKFSTWHYKFSKSPEDLLLLSFIRFMIVIVGYRFFPGKSALVYRPSYLPTTFLAGILEVVFASVKIGAVRSDLWSNSRAEHSIIAMCSLSICFACLHCAAAQGALVWARRRSMLALMMTGEELFDNGSFTDVEANQDQSLPCLTGEDNEILVKRASEGEEGWDKHIALNYKIVLAQNRLMHQVPERAQDLKSKEKMCIMLYHGFAGGIHSWRNVMEKLACSTCLPVVAFDRPGFGSTTRPNPDLPMNEEVYSMEYSAIASMHLASFLGFKKLILVGFGDGAMIALLASALTQPSFSLTSDTTVESSAFQSSILPTYNISSHDSETKRYVEDNMIYKMERSTGVSKERSSSKQWDHLSKPTLSNHDLGEVSDFHFPEDIPSELSSSSDGKKISCIEEKKSLFPIPTRLQYDVESHSRLVMNAGMILIHPDLTGFSGPPHLSSLLEQNLMHMKNLMLFSGNFALELGEIGHTSAWASGSPPPDVIQLYRKCVRGPNWQKCLQQVCQESSLHLTKIQRNKFLEEATSISTPILIIDGDRDKIGKRKTMEIALQVNRKISMAVVPDSMKVAVEENPKALTSIMERFILGHILN